MISTRFHKEPLYWGLLGPLRLILQRSLLCRIGVGSLFIIFLSHFNGHLPQGPLIRPLVVFLQAFHHFSQDAFSGKVVMAFYSATFLEVGFNTSVLNPLTSLPVFFRGYESIDSRPCLIL